MRVEALQIPISLSLVFSALVMLVLPNFIYVAFSMSSYALGLVISSLVILGFYHRYFLFYKLHPIRAVAAFAVLSVFLSSSIVSYVFYAETKPLFSLFPLFIVVLSSLVLARYIREIKYESLANTIFILILVLFVLGWVDLWNPIMCCNYSLRAKAVFPFSEESHYALALGLLSVSYACVASRSRYIFTGLNLFALSLIFPSLALLVFAVLFLFVGMLRLRRLFLIIFLMVFGPLIFYFGFPWIMGFEYFSSRLAFQEANNLTTLVFLQGWEMAYLNLVETRGLGLGFQMLGLSGTYTGALSDMIFAISGREANLMDGGLLAAKLVSEFGVLGIMMIVGYLLSMVKFIVFANSAWTNVGFESVDNVFRIKRELLFGGMIFAFLVELFFRSVGYFSPTLVFVIIAMISTKSPRSIKFFLASKFTH